MVLSSRAARDDNSRHNLLIAALSADAAQLLGKELRQRDFGGERSFGTWARTRRRFSSRSPALFPFVYQSEAVVQ
jgi:hypothetical protein